MSNVRPDVAAKLRRWAYIPLGAAAVLILAVWGVYLLAARSDRDVLHHGHPPDRSAVQAYLIVSVAATVLGIPVAILSQHRTLALANRGVQTSATIAKVGTFGKKGIRLVTFAYTVAGKEYTVARAVSQSHVDRYDEQTTFPLVYDPARPSRCEVLWASGERGIDPACRTTLAPPMQ